MLLKRNIVNIDSLNQIREFLIQCFGEISIKRKKVLWVEWWTEGREIEQMKHVIIFLRDILLWDIDLVSSFNPLPIFFNKYDLAILSGIAGSKRGINWAECVFENSSIPIFISYTEGIFRESEIEEFVWGHQKKNKKALWTTCSCWSQKSYNLINKYYPFLKKTNYVSGSLVIDDYVIDDFLIDKNSCNNYDFGIILNDDMNSYETLKRNFGIDYANNWLFKFHREANKYLVSFIDKFHRLGYKFVVKPHPGLRNVEHSVLNQIKDLNNVVVLNDNYSFKEFLKSAKIFISQNSTASIQAICLKKPVFRLGDYPPCFEEYLEIPKLEILEKNYEIKNKFKLKENYDFFEIYNKILPNTIGYSDGFNHLRFVNSILKSKQIYKKRRIKFTFKMYKYVIIFCLLKIAYKLNIPFSYSFRDRFEKFDVNDLQINLNKTSNNLFKFYELRFEEIINLFGN